MIPKHFSEILQGVRTRKKNVGPDPIITGIAYDSREVGKGSLFVALSGEHTDGHLYAREAIKKGAVALVVERLKSPYGPAMAFAQTTDTRLALSRMAANFYDNPSAHLYVIGVTGTDGKSSTVWFIQQLLEFAGKESGFISTVSLKTAGSVLNNPFRQSTPEATEIHRILAEMVSSGKNYAVVEATSHGLSHRTARLRHVWFDAGIFTNLTHEHLEFHGGMKKYREDKANLFRVLSHAPEKTAARTGQTLAAPHFAVLNQADPSCKYLAKIARVPCYTYGLDAGTAHLSASRLQATAGGTDFILNCGGKEYNLHFAHPGFFNIENLLASLLAVSGATGLAVPELLPFIPRLTAVRGRMQPVTMGQPFRVIVDFAHTPAAFAKLLPFMRAETKGRLICVFGSAGERDTAKREMQGKMAARYCHLVILTDEDPRAEDSLTIMEDIARGCRELTREQELFLVADRRQALTKALTMARPADTVLLLGKGHEKSIIYKDRSLPWDEVKVAGDILKNLGYAPSSPPRD